MNRRWVGRTCGVVWALSAMVLLMATSLRAAEVTVERSDHGATVRIDGELFAEYVIRSGHLPAVGPIIGPTGQPMSRSYPVGPLLEGEMDDHPHHHSLWFTHGDVNGLDFWRAPEITPDKKDNQIKHREFVSLESLGSTATIVTRNDWISDGEKICEDERALEFGVDGRGRRWIDFAVRLKATDGELHLGETKEGTFGVRMSAPLTVDSRRGARLVNSRGHENGKAWGMFAEWLDNYGPVDGEIVGLAMFSHPENFRHPTRWHARTYGLLAANPFGEGEFPKDDSEPKQHSVTIAPGEELALRYRVLLHRGDPTEADVAVAYQEYAGSRGSASQ